MTPSSDRHTKKVQSRGSGAKKLLAVSATAVLAGLAVAAPALAATPPQLPHDITAFPQRDMVVADGYAPNTRLNITVRSGGGALEGRAVGTTDRTGFLEVNHPGGICWGAGANASLQVTPDISPEDVVTVDQAGPVESDSSRIINVQINKDDPLTTDVDESGAASIEGNNVVVHGTAQNPDGSRIPLDKLEQRIIQPGFRDQGVNPDSRITRRDIRADGNGGRVQGVANAQGNLSYDGATGNAWTATYTGLNQTERELAVEGQTRIMSWMEADAAGERLGLTIFEEDEVNGPGMGGCPPGPGPVVPPAAPNAPLLYDNDQADDDPANPTFQTYDTSKLLDPAVATTDLTQLHEVVVFPERDFVSVAGFTAGQNLEVVVRRPGVGVVGSSVGVVGRDGVFEVNHPGGEVWTGQTPDIEPGDMVDVVQFDDPDGSVAATGAAPGGKNGDEVVTGGETQRTINVTANPAVRNNNGTPNNRNDDRLVIRGTAVDAAAPGGRVPLDKLEQRIIQPELNNTRIGRRDIRADSQGGRVENVPGGSGRLVYDSATSTNWTATYRGLNNNEIRLALEGQVRILSWLAADAAGERFGITIFEVGEQGGPGMGGAPPAGDEALPVVE